MSISKFYYLFMTAVMVSSCRDSVDISPRGSKFYEQKFTRLVKIENFCQNSEKLFNKFELSVRGCTENISHAKSVYASNDIIEVVVTQGPKDEWVIFATYMQKSSKYYPVENLEKLKLYFQELP